MEMLTERSGRTAGSPIVAINFCLTFPAAAESSIAAVSHKLCSERYRLSPKCRAAAAPTSAGAVAIKPRPHVTLTQLYCRRSDVPKVSRRICRAAVAAIQRIESCSTGELALRFSPNLSLTTFNTNTAGSRGEEEEGDSPHPQIVPLLDFQGTPRWLRVLHETICNVAKPFRQDAPTSSVEAEEPFAREWPPASRNGDNDCRRYVANFEADCARDRYAPHVTLGIGDGGSIAEQIVAAAASPSSCAIIPKELLADPIPLSACQIECFQMGDFCSAFKPLPALDGKSSVVWHRGITKPPATSEDDGEDETKAVLMTMAERQQSMDLPREAQLTTVLEEAGVLEDRPNDTFGAEAACPKEDDRRVAMREKETDSDDDDCAMGMLFWSSGRKEYGVAGLEIPSSWREWQKGKKSACRGSTDDSSEEGLGEVGTLFE